MCDDFEGGFDSGDSGFEDSGWDNMEPEVTTEDLSDVMDEAPIEDYEMDSFEPEEMTVEDIPDVPEEVVVEDIPDTTMEDIPDTVVEDIPDTTVEDIPDTVVEDIPDTTVEDIPDTTVEDIPDTVVEDIPDTTVEDIPDTVVEDIPDATVEDVPDVTVEDVPETIEEDVPETVEEDVPDAAVEDIPDTVMEEVPEEIPPETDSVPEEVPEEVPQEVPQEVPETGDPAMDAMTKYMYEHNYGKEDYPEYSQDPEWQQLNNDLLEEDGKEPIEYPEPETQEGSAMDAMTEYMYEHNYGKEDYPEYSQDPEWQQLNNDLLEEDGREPIEYPEPEVTEPPAEEIEPEIAPEYGEDLHADDVTDGVTDDVTDGVTDDVTDDVTDGVTDDVTDDVTTAGDVEEITDTMPEDGIEMEEDRVYDIPHEDTDETPVTMEEGVDYEIPHPEEDKVQDLTEISDETIPDTAETIPDTAETIPDTAETIPDTEGVTDVNDDITEVPGVTENTEETEGISDWMDNAETIPDQEIESIPDTVEEERVPDVEPDDGMIIDKIPDEPDDGMIIDKVPDEPDDGMIIDKVPDEPDDGMIIDKIPDEPEDDGIIDTIPNEPEDDIMMEEVPDKVEETEPVVEDVVESTETSETPALDALTKYMSEHEYGAEDFEEYSKDPEWQQLNNDRLVEMGQEPIEYPVPEGTEEVPIPEDAEISDTAEVPPEAEIPPIEKVDEWLGEINPNYDEFDPESPYCNNCGSCAYAVYRRLEGDTEIAATETNIGYNEDMEALTGMEQVSMSPLEIEARLLEQGNGAHAIIGIDRATGPGHWFNAANIDGKVVAIDGQTGEILDWPPDYGNVVNWEMSIKKGDK